MDRGKDVQVPAAQILHVDENVDPITDDHAASTRFTHVDNGAEPTPDEPVPAGQQMHDTLDSVPINDDHDHTLQLVQIDSNGKLEHIRALPMTPATREFLGGLKFRDAVVRWTQRAPVQTAL